MVTLKPKFVSKYPIEGRSITPDVFAGKTIKEVSELEAWEGNRKLTLADLFEISDDTDSKDMIKIVGDASKVRNVGMNMTSGKILVDGEIGWHVGEMMRGGSIVVTGNTGSWAGSQMKGGTIEIKGDTGDYIGSAYRGSDKGMTGGTVIVHGNAGNEIGNNMKGGLIKVMGTVGIFAGVHMHGGTILIQGESARRAGGHMTGGKIILMGKTEDVLPSFSIEEIKKSVKVEGEKVVGPFYLFEGDMAADGKGKLYISQPNNPQLSSYEKYLE
ncbi:MAG: formylmethanofuran dehydrogenase subunit C [Candidatus Bathyarchaeota archaeon]|nr:formylmethanofuran dehydrogenase subunit C [Candidatus Bathyarchaeum tardum]WNZ29149.1 MAG: formylmethanofuran dehydrogenase subunit C [Candidatus Bathyarchaeota archaeon]